MAAKSVTARSPKVFKLRSRDTAKKTSPRLTRFGCSLLDILSPPVNLWLKKLEKGIAVLPDGVRIIKHNGDSREERKGSDHESYQGTGSNG